MVTLLKIDAGEPGSIQQLCEASFRLPGLERNAVQQSLFSETPSMKPPSCPFGKPFCNSVHVISNCPAVRL